MPEPTLSRQSQLAILAAGLLSFIGILVETSMNVTFPTLIATLHVSLATVQWLTTAYLLLVTIVMSATAFVLKRFSFRALFFFAASMSLLGTLVAMLAPNFALLLLGRLLQAVATGLSTPLMFQLVFTRAPLNKLGLYTGFASIIISLAPALGPTYGGIVTSLWSWRAIFVGVLPLLLIATLIGAYAIHGPALGTRGQAFDGLGLALLAVTFGSLVLTANMAGTHGWLSGQFGALLAGAVVLILVMAWYARHGRRRLFDYRILGNAVVRQRLLQYFGLQFINIGLSFVLPLYVQDVLGASPMSAGLMMLPGALIGAIVAPLAGRSYDRIGAAPLLILSASLAGAAMALFAGFTGHLTVGLIALLYTLLRIGFNTGFGTAVSDASLQVTGPQKADQNAMFSMMQQFAGSLGTSLMAAVIAARALHSKPMAATISGSRADFLGLLGLAVVILLSAVVIAKRQAANNQ
ncbi:MFS transporter [Lacticaseibacillus nasuensis]|uniref:Transport protein n=1 Tax=Lacticaseibacillus nasuensis JCM 17158 TaxID=1291734 RepID=A0A0R1JZE9_9LACO|nr:MFS transporter [Lacticaseibacillus nasuensis]KRK74121.1 transport protein [Lacticaseibacillus nasuensis JCM 17158]